MRSALPDAFVGEISGKAPTGRSCKWPFSFPFSTTTVLQTLLRGRNLPAWKQRVTWYAVRLGGSSRITHGAGRICKHRGSANADMQMPLGGETNLLRTPCVG